VRQSHGEIKHWDKLRWFFSFEIPRNCLGIYLLENKRKKEKEPAQHNFIAFLLRKEILDQRPLLLLILKALGVKQGFCINRDMYN
jgi:hypothetical protein